MAGRLEGKVAFITGGGGGVGHATGQLFWEEGASVALVDIDGSAAERAADAISSDRTRVLPITAGLESESMAKEAIDRVASHFGRLDILANVAGVRTRGPITEADAESWSEVIGGNLLAPAYCARFAIPHMAAAGGGSIINISSSNAVKGRPGMAQYDSTKSALFALTRDIAHETGHLGIRANTICPGRVLTGYQIRRRAQETGLSLEEAEAQIRANASAESLGNILGRHSTAREIAYGILFLASDESSYVTGTTLMIDGGVTA